MDGREVGEDRPAPSYDWIGTEPDEEPRRRVVGRRLRAAAALVVVLAVAAAAWNVTRDTDWPSGCHVGGRPDWCSAPSDAITDPALVAFAHAYCPSLTQSPVDKLAPRPLSELGLADEDTFARTTGTSATGSEDALLGASSASAGAWITRWQSGLVEVRCPGSSSTTPSLRLQADQFASTVAADTAGEPRLDIADVAADLKLTMSGDFTSDVSYGYLGCDTAGIELSAPKVGETFSCAVEVYGLQWQGDYRASYRVTDEHPYFELLR